MYPTYPDYIIPAEDYKIFNLFIQLIEICDSFDQLGKLAALLDTLYPPSHPKHSDLFKALEKIARHLRGLPPLVNQELVRSIPPNLEACAFCGYFICNCEVPF